MNTKIEGSHWGKKGISYIITSISTVGCTQWQMMLFMFMWIMGWHYRKLSGFLIFHPSPEKKLFKLKLSLKYIFVYRMGKKDKTTPRLFYNYLQTNSAYMQSPFQKSVDIHYFVLFVLSMCVYLVMHGPSQIFKTSIIKKVLRVHFQPKAQLFNTHCPDLRQLVPITMHKHTTESGIHHGGQLLSVFSQLQHTNIKQSHSDTHILYRKTK